MLQKVLRASRTVNDDTVRSEDKEALGANSGKGVLAVARDGCPNPPPLEMVGSEVAEAGGSAADPGETGGRLRTQVLRA